MEVIARDASTVVLMRDRDEGAGPPEVLLMRRHAKANFGAGAYVFPGGMLEPQDYSPDVLALASGMSVAEAAREMPDVQPAERALGLRIAAFRETFEEAGALLGRRQNGDWFHPSGEEARLMQSARDDEDYYALVRQLGLRLPMDNLVYFGHWITPVCRPVRFDTRFFLLPVTEHLDAMPDHQEVFDDKWVTPAEAVEQQARGELRLMNPTLVNLSWLAAYGSTMEAVEALREKTVETIMPRVVTMPDGRERIIQPWDEDYAQA